jgi:hypothetical protein
MKMNRGFKLRENKPKQRQFADCPNECKPKSNKELPKEVPSQPPPKQTQTNPIKKDQRAYVFKLETGVTQISFTLDVLEKSPVVNPCFVIKNWQRRAAKASVKINGKCLPVGNDFRQGLIRDTDGTPTMVTWFKTEPTKPLKVSVSRCANQY